MRSGCGPSGCAVGNGAAVEHLQRRGDRTRREDIVHADRRAELCALVGAGVTAHQHGEFREIGFGVAVFMHVVRCEQSVVRRNGRAQRHLVVRVTHLSQDLDRRIPALASHAVLAAHHQDALGRAAGHDEVGQHHQGKTGCAAQLHGVRVARRQAEVLRKQRRQHQVRQGRRVTADQAVDVPSLHACIGQGQSRGLAHEVEAVAPLVPAVAGQAAAHEMAHCTTLRATRCGIRLGAARRLMPPAPAVRVRTAAGWPCAGPAREGRSAT